MTRCIRSSLLILFCLRLLVAQDVPKADVFFGYSFLRFNSAQTIPAFTANGGLGTLAWDINNHVALEAELGGYHNGNVNNYHFDTTTFNYLFGPRLSLGRSRTIDPYFHILWGGQYATTSIASNSILVTNPLIAPGATPPERYKTSTNSFAMAVGGGLDIKLSHSVVLRPIQADYFLTRFEAPDVTQPPGTTNPRARNQNNFRYAAGIAFNFGGESAGPPPPRITTKTCPDGSTVAEDQECPKRNISLGLTVSQSDVCAGAVVKIAPAGTLPQGAAMQWTLNGQQVNQSPEFELATNGRPSGSYRIGLKVAAEGFNDASAETAVTVRSYQPPSGSVEASPAEVWVGEKASLSADFKPGQCGGPLQPAVFTASEGVVNGSEFDSSTVAFDPSNNSEQRKAVTITAKVSDLQGSGSAETQITVKKKESITAKRLPDVVFPVNSARVNNCGKRVLLEELKTYTDSDSTATVYFVGHRTDKESPADLDLKRAMNAAAVTSAGKGICSALPASQIFITAAGTDQTADFQPRFCGSSTEGAERSGQSIKETDDSANLRRVEVWLVPTNGKAPALSQEPKDAASLGVASLGCPR